MRCSFSMCTSQGASLLVSSGQRFPCGLSSASKCRIRFITVRLLLLSSTFRGLPGLGPRHGPPVDGPSRAPAACFAAAGRVMGLSLFVENTGDAPELPDVLGSERAQVVQ